MRNLLFRRRSTIAATVFSVLQAAAPLHAAEKDPRRLPTIAVDADEDSLNTEWPPRRNTPSRCSTPPQTIQVIPQAVIRERAATTLRDALRNSPGITFQAGEGGGGLPGDQNFSMRGTSARKNLFVDGVRIRALHARFVQLAAGGSDQASDRHIETKSGTLLLEHDFSDSVTARNVLRYLDSDRSSAITAPRPPNRQLQRRDMETQNITNLTDVNVEFATGAIRHSLVTGLELTRETINSRNSAQTTNQPTLTAFFDPDPNARPLGPMPANTGDPSETEINNVELRTVVRESRRQRAPAVARRCARHEELGCARTSRPRSFSRHSRNTTAVN